MSDRALKIVIAVVITLMALLFIFDEGAEASQRLTELHTREFSMQLKKDIPPTVAAADETLEATETVENTEEEEPKEERHTSDGKLTYDVPEDAPWWGVVAGSGTDSEKVTEGEEGQVSTLNGNGTQNQNEMALSLPGDIATDSKGNTYFIDGSEDEKKLRMYDGEKNSTIVDLMENKIIRRDGHFNSSGIVVIHDNVYISNEKDIYQVVDDRITQLTPKIRKYMEREKLATVYRIEKHKDFIYILFQNKSLQYHMAKLNVAEDKIETVFDTKPLPTPYSFYVHGDNEIFLATTNGYVIWEVLFPRETRIAFETGDPTTEIVDVWIGADDSMYFVAWEEQTRAILYEDPVGDNDSGAYPVMGSRRGFVDGFNDEVEMDHPMSFEWDGTGYVFADRGNHALRKYWTETGPMNK
jgi:hypothetical protein